MKRFLILWIVLLPVLLLGQQGFADEPIVPGDVPGFWEELIESDSLTYGAGGVVGAVTVDGVTYSQIRLRPEIEFGKLGVGLDIDLLIDSDGKIRQEDWNDWKDYLGKLFYIRYGRRKDLLYFKTGAISDYTLGHGMIFNNYSNMLRYPDDKNIGSYVGMNTRLFGLGFELYTHDLFRNQILAGRVHAKPMQYLKIPYFENFKLGFNIGWDRDQLSRFTDDDGDGVPDVYDKFPSDPQSSADTDDDGISDDIDWDINGDGVIDGPANPAVEATFPGIFGYYPDYEFDNDFVTDSLQVYTDKQPLFIYSVDYELPVIDHEYFKLSTYGELAKIQDHGSGLIFPGFGAKFLIFEAKLELRNFGRGFLPSYFDRIYEGKRSELQIVIDPDTGQRHYSLITKEQILDQVKPTMGWFGYMQAELWEMLYFRAAYQDMYGKDMKAGKSIWAKLGATPKVIPKLKQATLYYSQTNVDYIDFRRLRTSQAHVVGELIYAIAENANLIGRYTEHYTDINNDGRIRGKNEIQEILTFGVEFTF